MTAPTSAKDQRADINAEAFSERVSALENCEFAGEVVTGEEELEELAIIVRREVGRAVQKGLGCGERTAQDPRQARLDSIPLLPGMDSLPHVLSKMS
jgi:hypothetical protein